MVSIYVALNHWADANKYENKDSSTKVNKGDFWYLASLSFSRFSLPKENIKHLLNQREAEQIYQWEIF